MEANSRLHIPNRFHIVVIGCYVKHRDRQQMGNKGGLKIAQVNLAADPHHPNYPQSLKFQSANQLYKTFTSEDIYFWERRFTM